MNNLNEIKENIEEVKQSQENAFVYAIEALKAKNKLTEFVLKCFFVIIILQMGIIVYQYWNNSQYGYIETTEEWSQDGDYNIYNKDGKMINGEYPVEVEDGETDIQENN